MSLKRQLQRHRHTVTHKGEMREERQQKNSLELLSSQVEWLNAFHLGRCQRTSFIFPITSKSLPMHGISISQTPSRLPQCIYSTHSLEVLSNEICVVRYHEGWIQSITAVAHANTIIITTTTNNNS